MIEGLKYWTVKPVDSYLYIRCDILADEERMKSFKLKREVYKEFREIEAYAKRIELKGLIGWAKPGASMMRQIIENVGAKPFRIWYRKEF